MKRLLLLLPLLLAGCIFGGDGRPPPPRRAHPAPAAAVPTGRETQACFADLKRERVDFTPIPDRDYGGGCALAGTVQLLDIGLPVTNIKGLRCGLARSFIGWARFAAAPAARQMLGSDLVRIETYGSYACRNVIGSAANAGRRSGHAIANAVDVSAFVLRDGRRITIERDWRSDDPNVRAFIGALHKSACRRFGTVLSPDYNAAHYNHLHLEDDRAGFCR